MSQQFKRPGKPPFAPMPTPPTPPSSERVPVHTTDEIIEAMLLVQLEAHLANVKNQIEPNIEERMRLYLQPRELNYDTLQVRQFAQLVYNGTPETKILGRTQIKNLMGEKLFYRDDRGVFFQMRGSLSGLGFDDDLRELGLMPPKEETPLEIPPTTNDSYYEQ